MWRAWSNIRQLGGIEHPLDLELFIVSGCIFYTVKKVQTDGPT